LICFLHSHLLPRRSLDEVESRISLLLHPGYTAKKDFSRSFTLSIVEGVEMTPEFKKHHV
jgi:hypothetical protein